jgi:hypothetical protein
MGKRSDFQRVEKDNYTTPPKAILPLLPHLTARSFIEPCAGSGSIVRTLEGAGFVRAGSFDLPNDAQTMIYPKAGDVFVTNPPWTREIMHPIIDNLRKQKDTWLLIEADWAHTKQAIPYLAFCRKIVSIGRVKWIVGSEFTGKDNSCWYLFGAEPANATLFYGL